MSDLFDRVISSYLLSRLLIGQLITWRSLAYDICLSGIKEIIRLFNVFQERRAMTAKKVPSTNSSLVAPYLSDFRTREDLI